MKQNSEYSIEDLKNKDIAIKFNNEEEFFMLMELFNSNNVEIFNDIPITNYVEKIGVSLDGNYTYKGKLSIEWDEIETYTNGKSYGIHKIISVNEVKGYV